MLREEQKNKAAKMISAFFIFVWLWSRTFLASFDDSLRFGRPSFFTRPNRPPTPFVLCSVDATPSVSRKTKSTNEISSYHFAHSRTQENVGRKLKALGCSKRRLFPPTYASAP